MSRVSVCDSARLPSVCAADGGLWSLQTDGRLCLTSGEGRSSTPGQNRRSRVHVAIQIPAPLWTGQGDQDVCNLNFVWLILNSQLNTLPFSRPPSPSRRDEGVTLVRGVSSLKPARATSCSRLWKQPSTCRGPPPRRDSPRAGVKTSRRSRTHHTCPLAHYRSKTDRHRPHKPLRLRSGYRCRKSFNSSKLLMLPQGCERSLCEHDESVVFNILNVFLPPGWRLCVQHGEWAFTSFKEPSQGQGELPYITAAAAPSAGKTRNHCSTALFCTHRQQQGSNRFILCQTSHYSTILCVDRLKCRSRSKLSSEL